MVPGFNLTSVFNTLYARSSLAVRPHAEVDHTGFIAADDDILCPFHELGGVNDVVEGIPGLWLCPIHAVDTVQHDDTEKCRRTKS